MGRVYKENPTLAGVLSSPEKEARMVAVYKLEKGKEAKNVFEVICLSCETDVQLIRSWQRQSIPSLKRGQEGGLSTALPWKRVFE